MRSKRTLHDVDTVAGSHFDGSVLSTVDWCARARTFVHAMRSCDRAVLLTLDDDGGLQLSSVPDVINALVTLRAAAASRKDGA